MATGIRKRHSRRCRSRDGAGGVCDCSPSFEAFVWSRRYKAKITRTFPTFADAKAWRAEATSAVDRGRLRRSTRKTIREASVELIDGMRDGSIRSSRRRPYRPSTIRSYERVTGVWPEQRERAPERLCERLGELRLTDARSACDPGLRRTATVGRLGPVDGRRPARPTEGDVSCRQEPRRGGDRPA